VVSGLVQTEAYAEAVLRELHHHRPRADASRLVQLRMLRQTRLDADMPFDLWLIHDESVLHRVVGGGTVMAGQLARLLEVTERPGVTIQVLPFTAGAHVGMRGAFSLLAFTGREPGAAYVESPAGIIFLEKPGELDEMRVAFERLSAAALSPGASRDQIARARRDISDLPTAPAPWAIKEKTEEDTWMRPDLTR
jgi:Domain of unknown function (DUF5753)